MEREKVLVLIFDNCSTKEVLKSIEDWKREGWACEYREKSGGLVVVLSLQESIKTTDSRLKVAGKSPKKVIRVWDEETENLGLRKRVDSLTFGGTKLRKIQKDLLQDFNKVQNSPQKAEKNDLQSENHRVLAPCNRPTPNKSNLLLTNPDLSSYTVCTISISGNVKPDIPLLSLNAI